MYDESDFRNFGDLLEVLRRQGYAPNDGAPLLRTAIEYSDCPLLVDARETTWRQYRQDHTDPRRHPPREPDYLWNTPGWSDLDDLSGEPQPERITRSRKAPHEVLLAAPNVTIHAPTVFAALRNLGIAVADSAAPALQADDKNKGGRPNRWDWERAIAAAVHHFVAKGFPPDVNDDVVREQATIAAWMARYLTERAGTGGEKCRPDHARKYAAEVHAIYRREIDEASTRLR
jgi:hypothetical protein